MPFYEKGEVRIHYEEAGSGFPLLVIPGGGLNSTVAGLATHPFNPFDEFKGEFRVIAADLRNAKGGQSTAPGGRPAVGRLYRRPYRTDGSPGRPPVHGARLLHRWPVHLEPVKAGRRPRRRRRAGAAQRLPPGDAWPLLNNNMKGWGPELCARRPDITMAMVDTFLTNMYGGGRADFVYTVTRDFVRNCPTPILVLPDDVPGHPYVVAMETVHLAPNAQVSLYPWKDTPDKIPLAVRHIRSFLEAHRPATAALNLWQPPPNSARHSFTAAAGAGHDRPRA